MALDLDALARMLEERLAPAKLTRRELSEALCIALEVPAPLSAAAAGVSVETVRGRRRRLCAKLEPLRRAVARAGSSSPRSGPGGPPRDGAP